MSKGKILIVDDEQIVLTAFRIELEQAGYDARSALSAKEAIARLLKERFDIVYTDLIMPEINGTQLCHQIKRLFPETEVVLFSGNPYEVEAQHEAFTAAGGRDEMLRKPLGEGVLIKVTENLMKEINYKKNLARGPSHVS
ncbi:MAG TPA: response regulator [Candidatus Omnitrophota bacterium]|nr:response regulator [Candidatus Omnitrophota bacterium]